MYGGPIGDIIGSPYEFDRGDKTKDFPLFSEESKFTDDTVMTVAVADALLGLVEGKNEAGTKAPEAITQECIRRIPEEMNEVLKRIS